jgi:hypothetical protein
VLRTVLQLYKQGLVYTVEIEALRPYSAIGTNTSKALDRSHTLSRISSLRSDSARVAAPPPGRPRPFSPPGIWLLRPSRRESAWWIDARSG